MFKTYTQFINESKDSDRIDGIISKANGDDSKEIQLATNMASSITAIDKAYDRGLIAYNYQKYELAKIFFDKAVQLGKKETPEIKSTNNQVSGIQISTRIKFNVDKIITEFKEKMNSIRNSYSGSNNYRNSDIVGLTPYQNFKSKYHKELNIKEIEEVINKLDSEYDLKRAFKWNDRTSASYWAKDFIETLLQKVKFEDPIFFKDFLHLHHFEIVDKENSEIKTKANNDIFIKLFRERIQKDDMIAYTKSKFHNSNSGPTLKLSDAFSCFVWCEIDGQFSDGMWENSKPDNHWEWIRDLNVVFDESSEGLFNLKYPKFKNYALSSIKEYTFEDVQEEICLAWNFGFKNIFETLQEYKFGSKITNLLKSKSYSEDSINKIATETNIPIHELKEFIGCYLSETKSSSLVSKSLYYIKRVIDGPQNR